MKLYVLINAFAEVPTKNAPASTTTKVLITVPISDGGSIMTAPPEIVTLEDETPIVENAVPPALPDLNVILPVPLVIGLSKVIMILELVETPIVAPFAGLKVMGTGGETSVVAVKTPTLKFLLSSITVVPEIFIDIFIILFLTIYNL